MFGINGAELLVIAVVALILVGPERLPHYAGQLRAFMLRVRVLVNQGQESVSRELGQDIDWNTLDPRQYDPRTIVKEAFFGEPGAPVTTRPTGPAHRPAAAPGGRPPVDHDAT